jgi:MFS family permease
MSDKKGREEAKTEVEDAAIAAKRKAAAEAAKPIILACAFMWMERLIVSQPAGQLVLSVTNGDTVRTATIMSLIGSIQSILKLVIAPVVGSMSDKIGRRPFLMISPPIWALTRLAGTFPLLEQFFLLTDTLSSVVAKPSVFTIALSRTVGHALFDAFQTVSQASLMDLHQVSNQVRTDKIYFSVSNISSSG